MMQDLVTIVIPTYNMAPYLRANVESIINQSYENLEIIYVCDGCTDQTAAILQEYAEKDSRIIILVEEENHGAAVSRNIGMERAKGDWIIFWDSDDMFARETIEIMLKTAIKEQADIAGCYWEDFDDTPSGEAYIGNGMRKLYCGTYPIVSTREEPCHIFQLIDNSPCTKLVHKSVYKKKEVFFQDIPNSNDVYYAMVAVLNSRRIVYVDEPFLYIRSNKGRTTISTDRDLKQTYILEALDTVYGYIRDCGSNPLLLRSFYNVAVENISFYSDYPTYAVLIKSLKEVYLQKWGMRENEVTRELSYRNRIFYKSLINGTVIDRQNINMQAKVEFVRVLSRKGCSIYGAGAMGRKLLEEISRAGIKVQHVFDSAQDKWGEEVQGYVIENFQDVRAEHIIVTVPRFYDEIERSIKGCVEYVYNLEQQIYLIPSRYEPWNEAY